MFPALELIFPLIRKGTFFPAGCFFPGHYVPTNVLSHQLFYRPMFCPSGCFVPPDVFSLGHFVPPDVFPMDVLLPNVWSPDVLLLDILSGHHLKNLRAILPNTIGDASCFFGPDVLQSLQNLVHNLYKRVWQG
jgi:hypothetical protein